MSRTFYRIAKASPPTLLDFTSKVAQGLVAPAADSVTRRLESGISVYQTEAQARKKASAFPMLGRYIVTLEIQENGPITWERTTNSRGHHTLWGEPAEIAARCVSTVSVR